jgi:hypothetical protein
MVLPAFLDPHLGGTRWIDGFQLGQDELPIPGHLHIKPVAGVGQTQSHSLFVVCYDCHPGATSYGKDSLTVPVLPS